MARSIIAPAERVTNLRWGIALILGFGVLINYIDRGALSVAAKPLHDELGLGAEQFGILSSAFFAVYAFSQIPIGYILDQYGVTIISRIAALLWSVASVCTAIAPNFGLIYTARLFLGLAEAPTFPANAKAVGYWFPRGERGLATSLFDAAAKLSNAIGVAFTAYLLVMFGWRGMFWTTAALSFVFFALFWIFYRNPSQDKRLTPAEAKYIREGGGEPESPAGKRPRGASLWYLLAQRKVWGLTIGFAAYGYLFAFLLTWLPTYLQSTFQINILKVGGYVFLIWGVGTLTDLIVGGWLVDYLIKRGYDANRVRKTILIAGLVLGFAVIGAAYTKDINVAVFWITIAVAGISFHAPVGWSIPGLISPTNSTGQVGSIMNFLNNVAGFFAPTITGIIVARTGSFNIALITAAVILIVGIFSYVVVLGRIDKIPNRVLPAAETKSAAQGRRQPAAARSGTAAKGVAVVVGVDLGTSAVKVLAVTTNGHEVASGSQFYGLETPQADFVEQDADVVYRATMHVLKGVLADVGLRGNEVAAIGFSSAMHGVLCVDDAGEPRSRVITWMDRRAHAIADKWRSDGTALALYQSTGAPMHPMLPIAKLRWLAENEPETFAKAQRFVGLKELVVFRWTGEWLVDHGIASATGMFDLRTRDWHPRALELAGVEPGRLSQPAPPTTARRRFRPAIARELGLSPETAIVLASSDGALANIGVGASGRDDVALTLGTSGAVRILCDEPILDARARTFCYCADDARYIVGGPTSAAGASLDWIFGLLLDEMPAERRFARAVELAAQVAPGADGLVVLPFFAGERAPYWNSALRGAFDGLDLAHDRRTILRAAFESVVFGVYSVYDVVRELARDAQRLLLSGGLTKSPLVRHLLADVFGMPAVQPREQEASAFGAALLAAQAVGLVDDAATAARAAGFDAPTEPNSELALTYRVAFERYRRHIDAHLPLIG